MTVKVGGNSFAIAWCVVYNMTILIMVSFLVLTLTLALTTVKGVFGQSDFQPFQRLVQPTSGSKLTFAPGFSLPNLQLNTIESNLNMKMPITVRFPTATEMAQNFILQVTGSAMANNLGAGHKLETSTTSKTSRSMNTRVNSRAKFYQTIENAHKGFGKSCLLRAICEVAEVPFIASHTGFIGEMLDLLLTSSSLIDTNGKLSEYIKAERIGRQSLLSNKDGCKREYKVCPFSLFKVIQIANEII